MPPKKKEPKGPSAKTLQKEKAKVVEDKTFGLKNKNKSKAVQQYVKQVTTQVMDGGTKKVGNYFSYKIVFLTSKYWLYSKRLSFVQREANALN